MLAPLHESGQFGEPNGERQWALVRGGSIISLSGYQADEPEQIDGCKWLPVEYRDEPGFDPAQHWRGKPEMVIEADKVVRTFPIVVKSLEAM